MTHSGLSGPAILRLSAFGARVLHVLECVGILCVCCIYVCVVFDWIALIH